MMRRAVAVGAIAGALCGAWNVVTMFWPVSYLAWDVGRSVTFIGLILALALLGRRHIHREASPLQTLATMATAFVAAACVALVMYATTTGLMANHIVQLPEYAKDYTHHGYTSPASYLSVNYWALLKLQVFSWTVSGVIVVGLAGVVARLTAGTRRLRAA